MKPLICRCTQCKYARSHQKKATRMLTKKTRAARHRVRQLLRTVDPEIVEDCLFTTIAVGYDG